jgi:phospholipid-binding lipoprotein MlaA
MRALLLAASLLLLAGCASAPSKQDPFEPVNRGIFAFNEQADRFVLKPIATAYKTVIPSPVRTGVGNFYGNIGDVVSLFNDLLQGKPAKASDDFGRVMLNSSFGLGGIFDLASEMGIERGEEDYGQTFGVWGIPQGPYLVIPILGPSTVRDGTGLLVQGFTEPIIFVNDVPTRNIIYGMRVVNTRYQLLGTEGIVEQAALDKYTFVRRAYLQRRRNLVYDGKPPPEDEEE